LIRDLEKGGNARTQAGGGGGQIGGEGLQEGKKNSFAEKGVPYEGGKGFLRQLQGREGPSCRLLKTENSGEISRGGEGHPEVGSETERHPEHPQKRNTHTAPRIGREEDY